MQRRVAPPRHSVKLSFKTKIRGQPCEICRSYKTTFEVRKTKFCRSITRSKMASLALQRWRSTASISLVLQCKRTTNRECKQGLPTIALVAMIYKRRRVVVKRIRFLRNRSPISINAAIGSHRMAICCPKTASDVSDWQSQLFCPNRNREKFIARELNFLR